MTSIDAGKEVLNYLSGRIQNYFYRSYSIEEMATANGYGGQKIPTFVAGVGDQYIISNVWTMTMHSAMDRLAQASKGKVPTLAAISAAFRDESASSFSFVELQHSTQNPIVYVAAGVADTALNGAQHLGNQIIDTTGVAVDKSAEAVQSIFKGAANTAKAAELTLPVLIVVAGVLIVVFYSWAYVPRAPRRKSA